MAQRHADSERRGVVRFWWQVAKRLLGDHRVHDCKRQGSGGGQLRRLHLDFTDGYCLIPSACDSQERGAVGCWHLTTALSTSAPCWVRDVGFVHHRLELRDDIGVIGGDVRRFSNILGQVK